MKFDVQTEDFPESFYAFIEIPQGSNCKYEYHFDVENVVLDRILFTSMNYPTNYGYILGTKAKDGDPLDVLIYSSVPINSGIVVKCKPVGIAEMDDEEGSDNKVIAVPVDKVDPMSENFNDVNDLPEYLKNKIKHFFEHYKELEKGKFMHFTDFKDREEAKKQIKESKL